MVQTDKKLNGISMIQNQDKNKSSFLIKNEKSDYKSETKSLTKDQINTINNAKNVANPFGSKFRNEAYFKAMHNF